MFSFTRLLQYTQPQKTSNVMPLHCLHADWDRDPPSLPFKSHKTINLTSTDHPILLGSPDSNTVSSSLDFTSRAISMEKLSSKEAPAHPVVVSDPEWTQGGFDQVLFLCCASLMSAHPAMSPRRTWLQTELMEVSVSSRWPWGTKVKSSAHNQKGYGIDRDDYFCTEYKTHSHRGGVSFCWLGRNIFANTGLLGVILMDIYCVIM